MNTYKITFQRENGTTGADRFTAATEAQARRDFKSCYRHDNYTITSAEIVADNAPATKEQERKALDKIKKIVDELGAGSYIATAFEGCFEIAESNIENDFACSMKQRAESAEALAEGLEIEVENRKAVIYEITAEKNSLKDENASLKKKILTAEEAEAIKAILSHSKLEAASLADSSAQAIVEYADRPDSAEFRQAVQDNRSSKKRMDECSTLIQRLLETMK